MNPLKCLMMVLTLGGLFTWPLANAEPEFDKTWSVVAGTIVYDCSALGNFACSTIADGNGVMQVQAIDLNTQESYLHTIIAADENNQTFASESFVRFGSALDGGANSGSGGVMAKQTLGVTTNAMLSSDFTMRTGDFSPTGTPQVALSQSVTQGNNVDAESFQMSFSFNRNGETSTVLSDQRMDSTLGTAGPVQHTFSLREDFVSNQSTNKTVDINNQVGVITDNLHTFEFYSREGAAVPEAGSASMSGSNVNWVAGDNIQHVLIGDRIISDGLDGGPSVYGFEYIANLTTPAEVKSTSFATQGSVATFTPANPFN